MKRIARPRPYTGGIILRHFRARYARTADRADRPDNKEHRKIDVDDLSSQMERRYSRFTRSPVVLSRTVYRQAVSRLKVGCIIARIAGTACRKCRSEGSRTKVIPGQSGGGPTEPSRGPAAPGTGVLSSIKFLLEFQRPGDREIEVGRWPRVKESSPPIHVPRGFCFHPIRPPPPLVLRPTVLVFEHRPTKARNRPFFCMCRRSPAIFFFRHGLPVRARSPFASSPWFLSEPPPNIFHRVYRYSPRLPRATFVRDPRLFSQVFPRSEYLRRFLTIAGTIARKYRRGVEGKRNGLTPRRQKKEREKERDLARWHTRDPTVAHCTCVIARGNHEREARPVILDKCASRHRSTLYPPTFTSTHVSRLIHLKPRLLSASLSRRAIVRGRPAPGPALGQVKRRPAAIPR